MKYEGIYGGNVVQCFPLKLKFQVDPGVRGIGYKVSVEVTNSGYSITTDKGTSLKILSVEPFEFDETQKKMIEVVDYEEIYESNIESFINEIQQHHKRIEYRGGINIKIFLYAEESYPGCDPEPKIKFKYNILETDEECYNRIRREEKVKRENEERDRRLFESLKERFGE